MTDQIKPCPFCGSDDIDADVIYFPYRTELTKSVWLVHCLKCHALGPIHIERTGAIAAWNTRDDDELLCALEAAYWQMDNLANPGRMKAINFPDTMSYIEGVIKKYKTEGSK